MTDRTSATPDYTMGFSEEMLQFFSGTQRKPTRRF